MLDIPLIEDDEEAMTADASPESEGEEAVGAGNSGEGEPETGEGATDSRIADRRRSPPKDVGWQATSK